MLIRLKDVALEKSEQRVPLANAATVAARASEAADANFRLTLSQYHDLWFLTNGKKSKSLSRRIALSTAWKQARLSFTLVRGKGEPKDKVLITISMEWARNSNVNDRRRRYVTCS